MHAEVTLLHVAEVCRRVGLSRPMVYRKMKDGAFPRPTYPAPRAPRWRSDEVAAWIERISAERASA